MILDLEKALKDGCSVPTAGVYRGERVRIVKDGPGTSVWIEFTGDHLYPGQHFNVDRSHLIEEPAGLLCALFVEKLREEHRLKLNTDYSYTHKYGETRILCASVFYDTINQVAVEFGLNIKGYYTY